VITDSFHGHQIVYVEGVGFGGCGDGRGRTYESDNENASKTVHEGVLQPEAAGKGYGIATSATRNEANGFGVALLDLGPTSLFPYGSQAPPLNPPFLVSSCAKKRSGRRYPGAKIAGFETTGEETFRRIFHHGLGWGGLSDEGLFNNHPLGNRMHDRCRIGIWDLDLGELTDGVRILKIEGLNRRRSWCDNLINRHSALRHPNGPNTESHRDRGRRRHPSVAATTSRELNIVEGGGHGIIDHLGHATLELLSPPCPANLAGLTDDLGLGCGLIVEAAQCEVEHQSFVVGAVRENHHRLH